MPRKPTIHTRKARAALIERAVCLPGDSALPSLAVMGEEYSLHPATVFRLLRDLTAEGVYWQSPSGKFFPASERRTQMKGAPLCFIGRELWQWSRLYQEVLEGISEICASNGSPLISLSSRNLVRQDSPTLPPTFASMATQSRELSKLLPHIPKGCAGIVLDHMWADSALKKCSWPGAERVQLLAGKGNHAKVVGPDWEQAARVVKSFVKESGATRIALVEPFSGDKAIDLLYQKLKSALIPFAPDPVAFQAESSVAINWNGYDIIVCPEDNIATDITKHLNHSASTRLIGTQGTRLLHAPHIRLRVDYRRLGRAVASYLLHGTSVGVFSHALVDPAAAE